jgi:glyoxylase-like metal-dependent hydrolase (beta-lactamase superfamily II)
MRIRITIGLLAALAACNSVHPELALDSASAIALTGGPNTSLIYVARTDSGIIAIDLGWWGHDEAFRSALSRVGAAPGDVRRVWVTHSHRDHIAAWPMIRGARLHLSAAEAPLLTGESSHRGRMVRAAERLNDSELPQAGELDVRVFSRDTMFTLGRDTLRAYIVPGHTAGSAVYLFRGVLFVGDAATHSAWRGFRSAKAQFSDDPKLAAESLEKLWSRIPLGGIRVLCTAHAECTEMTSALRERLGAR